MNADERRYDENRDDPQDLDLNWAAQEDESDDFEDDTRECPDCGKRLHWDAPRCPACGAWLHEPSLAAERSTTWLWPILVAVIVAVILVVWQGLGR